MPVFPALSRLCPFFSCVSSRHGCLARKVLSRRLPLGQQRTLSPSLSLLPHLFTTSGSLARHRDGRGWSRESTRRSTGLLADASNGASVSRPRRLAPRPNSVRSMQPRRVELRPCLWMLGWGGSGCVDYSGLRFCVFGSDSVTSSVFGETRRNRGLP